jgi:HAD superfamily hydrolase (TIGR01549 family)
MKKHKRGTQTDQLMRTCDAAHIAFDLDSTLSTYPLTTAQVIAAALARCGLDVDAIGAVDELASEYDALWLELQMGAASPRELRLAIWERILARRNLSEALAAPIAAAYGDVRRETGIRLFEGVPEMLALLRARGYRLGLLTNGLSELQWEKIRALDLEPRLDAVVVADDIGCSKPDGRAFAALLDLLAARAEDTLFVGDSYDADIVGAHGAGMQTAWVSPDGADCPGPVVPDYVLAAAAEVERVLP